MFYFLEFRVTGYYDCIIFYRRSKCKTVGIRNTKLGLIFRSLIYQRVGYRQNRKV
jgi:hypothetical protein